MFRVDEDNRLNFVNTLCEIAKSKQVILTFTPTEYDEKVSADCRINSAHSANYHWKMV